MATTRLRSVRVSDELWADAHAAASEIGVTVSGVMVAALEALVAGDVAAWDPDDDDGDVWAWDPDDEDRTSVPVVE